MADPVGQVSSQTNALSPWAAPYVTDMLSKGQALASMPYQGYTGPISAGASGLQQQAFQGLAGLAVPFANRVGSFAGSMPSYGPSTMGGPAQQLPPGVAAANTPGLQASQGPQLPPGVAAANTPGLQGPQDMGMQAPQAPQAQQSVAQQYMNPYMDMALRPQMEEARRQAQIEQQNLQSRYGRAGAYGGGRQAVAEAELSGALQRNLANIYGTGMEKAYDKAADLFGQERDYGLRALGAQSAGGQTQRDIAQQGIAANIAQFEEERDYPYKQLQFQQSLLQGLPVQQIQRDYIPQSDLSKALGIIGGVSQAGKDVKDFFDLF